MITKEISANMINAAFVLFRRIISLGIVVTLFSAPLTEAATLSPALRAKRTIYQYANRGNVTALKRLKERGVSLDIADEKGNTALCSAVNFRNVTAYNALIEAGADLQADCMDRLPAETRERFCINANLADRSICSSVIGNSGDAGIAATSSDVGATGITTSALITNAAGVAVAGVAVAAVLSSGGGGGGGDDPKPACTTADDCNNHGECTDGVCVCDDGYTGSTCEIETACIGVDCGLHGSCAAGICICSDGWNGDHCEIPPPEDPCADIDCGEHGTCYAGACICSDGWAGDYCTIEPEPCYDVNCGAHGVCDDTVLKDGKGTCKCFDDFSGDYCQIPPKTDVPEIESTGVHDSTLCDEDNGYRLINGVCTKAFATYVPGIDTAAISLTPDNTEEEWDVVVTNIGPGPGQYPSKPKYLAEFGGAVTNATTLAVSGSTTQQVGMWANGLSKDAVTLDGSKVVFSQASTATNTSTGVINAVEGSNTDAGVIGMKASAGATVSNAGKINVTALSSSHSAAIDATRHNAQSYSDEKTGEKQEEGANIENSGIINLTVKENAADVQGINAPDRNVLNTGDAQINVTIGKTTASGYDRPDDVHVSAILGQMIVNRGTISVQAEDKEATGAGNIALTDIKIIETPANGAAYNDGILNLDMTNLMYSVYGIYPNAGESTKAVNNGTINVTGRLYNDTSISKQVYMVGSGTGVADLLNEGIINIGSPASYFDVSQGGYFHVMDGLSGTATNNQQINLYLNSSSDSKPFSLSVLAMQREATSTNNGVINATLTGTTNLSSQFVVLDSYGEQSNTQTNNGIIRVNSSTAGADIIAMYGAGAKGNSETGKIYLTSTAENSDIITVSGGGTAQNKGLVILTHDGGSGNITGYGGGNVGQIYIRAKNMTGASLITAGGTGGSVDGGVTDDSTGLIDITLSGSTSGVVLGYDYSGLSDYSLSNRIDIKAEDPTRNGGLVLTGVSFLPTEQTTGSLTRGGDTYINVHDSPYGITEVIGLYSHQGNIINTKVLNISATIENSYYSLTPSKIIGMYSEETYDVKNEIGHPEPVKAINNNTIRILVNGNASYFNTKDVDPNIPFDVVGMLTNSYAQNNGTIEIKVSGSAKAAGMVAYGGGVLVNKGSIKFEGQRENFTPFYATGQQDLIVQVKEEAGSKKVTQWETVYASIHNYGDVIINGTVATTDLAEGDFYSPKPVNYDVKTGNPLDEDWARRLYVWDEETSQYLPKILTYSSKWNSTDGNPEPEYFDPAVDPLPTTITLSSGVAYVAEKDGVFSADGYLLAGNVTAGSSLIMDGNKDIYVGNGKGEGALIGNGDASQLGLASSSPLFEAFYQTNAYNPDGLDIVMARRSFTDVVSNKSLASFLEANYTAGKNEAFFNQLKSFEDISSLSDSLNLLTGNEMISRFNFEDLTMMRELNFDMNTHLFHNKEQNFALAGSVSPMAFQGDIGSNSRYSLFNKRTGPFSVGLGVAFTNLKSDDTHNNNDRHDMMYQLIVPFGYKTNGIHIMTSPRIGYARGTYSRTGFADQSYTGHIEKRVFGLMNEARYPIAFGDWTLEPATEFNILGYTQRGHEDVKDYSLRLKSQKTYSVEAGLGLYLTQDKALSKNSRLNLLAGVAAYHEFADPYRTEIGMNGMEGSFTLRDENHTDNRGIVRLGLDYNYKDYTLYGSFMSYIDREVRSSFKTGMKWSF